MPSVPYQISIAIDAVVDAVGDFIQPFVGTAEIIRAQVNRVAPPPNAYVELTELRSTDLETPIDDNEGTITGPKQIDVQIDFYGPNSGDWCNAVKTVFRSSYAPAQFPDGIKPLFASDGIQGPLITGEQQYESRWTLTASLQYNPSVYIPVQSATELAVNILEDLL